MAKRNAVEKFEDRLLHAKRVLRTIEEMGGKANDFQKTYENLPRAVRTKNSDRIAELQSEVERLQRRLALKERGRANR